MKWTPHFQAEWQREQCILETSSRALLCTQGTVGYWFSRLVGTENTSGVFERTLSHTVLKNIHVKSNITRLPIGCVTLIPWVPRWVERGKTPGTSVVSAREGEGRGKR